MPSRSTEPAVSTSRPKTAPKRVNALKSNEVTPALSAAARRRLTKGGSVDDAIARVMKVLGRRLPAEELQRGVESWKSFVFMWDQGGRTLPFIDLSVWLFYTCPSEVRTRDLRAASAAWHGASEGADNVAVELSPRGRLKVPEGFVPKKLFGETLVALKLCTAAQIRDGLRLQKKIEAKTSRRLPIGVLLTASRALPFEKYLQALALHLGEPYEVERFSGPALDRLRRSFRQAVRQSV